MKYHSKGLTALLSFIVSVLSVQIVAGQSKIALDVEDPKFEALQSPDFNSSAKKSWKAKDWMEIEVEFEITKTDLNDAEFIDSLIVKWYVAAQNPDSNKKEYVLLEKEVEHVNIPVKERLFSSVYLAPSAVARLSGKDRATKRVIDRVGGEILYKGARVGYFSSQGKAGWWQSGSLSRYNKIPLRSKDETPFNYYWWDRYAETKVSDR